MAELIWALVLLWNLATLATYGGDRWRSKKQRGRVSERTLLLMLFATGWWGAWLGMGCFGDKSASRPLGRSALTGAGEIAAADSVDVTLGAILEDVTFFG